MEPKDKFCPHHSLAQDHPAVCSQALISDPHVTEIATLIISAPTSFHIHLSLPSSASPPVPPGPIVVKHLEKPRDEQLPISK